MEEGKGLELLIKTFLSLQESHSFSPKYVQPFLHSIKHAFFVVFWFAFRLYIFVSSLFSFLLPLCFQTKSFTEVKYLKQMELGGRTSGMSGDGSSFPQWGSSESP